MRICKLISLIMFFIIFYMLSLSSLNTHGFCKSKMSFISSLYTDEDIINKGIQYLINKIETPNREEICISDTLPCDKHNDKQKLFYKNISEFKKLNKECCNVKSLGVVEYPMGVWGKLLGDEYGIVEINYFRFFYQEGKDNFKEARKVNIVFNTCGEMVKHIDLSNM